MQGRAPGTGFDLNSLDTLGNVPRVLALRGMLRSVASQVSSVVPGASSPHPEDLPSCS